jgi:hypothetical protein
MRGNGNKKTAFIEGGLLVIRDDQMRFASSAALPT